MEISVYRDQALSSEARTLAAATYNLAHSLLARSPSGVVFVPIRSMQMLAIIDREEFVFLDGQYKSWVEIAWQHFQPQARCALDAPVPYQLVIYHPDGEKNLGRLLVEFPKALQALSGKQRPDGPARLLKFEAKRPAGA
ncbi:hypothetical protein EDC61_10538 [Sulfuritortus calidifontis]|uniref:Uncharacterized protein n=1 Tax=Sulfuritortus calidifontis TaxID=1914471 RepID=A0A4R3JW11_9PROT|nr:hypothetical protein [Sulfuritortus calidifontis]TCS72384.1 hypothetical protein EDC61_10538 [Sulfuritortus calidifontis]